MAVTGIPADLSFLCKVLSPWTTEKEIQHLRNSAGHRQVDWDAVVAYANRSNLAPALRHGLAARGLWKVTPARLRQYLDYIYLFNGKRNLVLLQQLREVIGLLNQVGISPLLLKGSAVLAMPLFSDPAVRFMWDIDLLVPDGMMKQAVAALKDTGYFVPEQFKQYLSEDLYSEFHPVFHHYPPLIKAGAIVLVELHHRLLSEQWAPFLETSALWRESLRLEDSLLPGLSFRSLSPTHQLIYCFAHSELAHRNHQLRRLDLRQLHDFAHLCSRWRNELDWPRLASLRKDIHIGRVLGAYFYLAKQFFGIETDLPSISDAYVRRHFSRVLFSVNGKWKRLLLAREFLLRLTSQFSSEQLRDLYPQKDRSSLTGLRLYRLGTLIRQYCRLGPWKELADSMVDKYDSNSLLCIKTSSDPQNFAEWFQVNDGR